MLSKKLFLSSIVLFVLVSLPLIGSVGASSMMWSQTYGGKNMDVGRSLVETSDGGYAIAGHTTSYGVGSHDFWLVKIDSNGNMEWNRTYGGAEPDRAYSLVETSDRGYAIAGGSRLVKTDEYGNMEWNKTIGGSAYSLVEASDGGYALAGEISTIVMGSTDFWLVKTDGYGNEEWNQTYEGTSEEGAFSLVVTSDGGFAIAGYTTSFGAGSYDFWLIKTDQYGIIPEFPSWIILPLFLTVTLVVAIFRRKLSKTGNPAFILGS